MLFFSCLVLALVALSLCPVSLITRAALILITLTGSVLLYMPTRSLRTLAWREDESWLFDDAHDIHEGFTTTGSYRSMLLVVVAIKPEQGRTQHAVVWRDAVPRSIFSALHIRLAVTHAHLLQ